MKILVSITVKPGSLKFRDPRADISIYRVGGGGGGGEKKKNS